MIAAALQLLQRAYLRYCIWDTERYMRVCHPDELAQSLSQPQFNAQLEAWRVQLATLQPRQAAPVPARADGAPCAAEACTELGSDIITVRFLAPRRSLLMALSVTVVIAGTAVFA